MPDFEFQCPHCREVTTVDGGVRELLLAEGCVACGRAVSPGDFQAVVE